MKNATTTTSRTGRILTSRGTVKIKMNDAGARAHSFMIDKNAKKKIKNAFILAYVTQNRKATNEEIANALDKKHPGFANSTTTIDLRIQEARKAVA